MKLYLVPTPIGNLGDMTLRAIEVLKSVDAILCEDTRTSGNLLKHFNIQKPLYPYHMHNEHKTTANLITQLHEGKTMALISDAGSPVISDPGFLLARACVEAGVPIESLPGATAFVPALSQSALPGNRFCFEGFLPQKKGRKTLLTKLAEEERTIIFYESPHRLAKTLEEISMIFGTERMASISREITKIHEDTQRGTLAHLANYYKERPPKGEIVVVVQGKS